MRTVPLAHNQSDQQYECRHCGHAEYGLRNDSLNQRQLHQRLPDGVPHTFTPTLPKSSCKPIAQFREECRISQNIPRVLNLYSDFVRNASSDVRAYAGRYNEHERTMPGFRQQALQGQLRCGQKRLLDPRLQPASGMVDHHRHRGGSSDYRAVPRIFL